MNRELKVALLFFSPGKLCGTVKNCKNVSEMEEEELLSPDEIRKIENELELKLANMTLEDLEESSGTVEDFLKSF